MKKHTLFTAIAIILVALAVLGACNSDTLLDSKGMMEYGNDIMMPSKSAVMPRKALGIQQSTDSYQIINDNPFYLAEETPASQFSLDINTAGYSNIRRYINEDLSMSKDMVKIEEMVNYFKYDLVEAPDEGINLNTTIMDTPWNDGATKLCTFSLRAEDIELSTVKNNLVFLIDTSGSMSGADRLGLVQSAFSMLTEALTDNDRVSIVTYASSTRTLLSGASGQDKPSIMNAIEDLTANGSTAGASGIELAYQCATANFIEGGNNRVILATDGDFNVGISSNKELESFISEKRNSGIYLSILGVGYGNLQDDKISTLTAAGNGTYAYLDSITEARRVLIEQMSGTLVTVAKDAKAQVTFNPELVEYYKLIGYENSLLTEEEWNDQTKDAGEIGAGHTVTAVYEITLKPTATEGKLATFTVRYKNPTDQSNQEKSTELDLSALSNLASPDQIFLSSVVEFGLLLRDSTYPEKLFDEQPVKYSEKGANLESIITRLNSLDLSDDTYKTEFAELVEKYANNNRP